MWHISIQAGLTESLWQIAIAEQLHRDESAFARGDKRIARNFQLSASRNLATSETISPELLQDLKRFQLKGGSRGLSLELDSYN